MTNVETAVGSLNEFLVLLCTDARFAPEFASRADPETIRKLANETLTAPEIVELWNREIQFRNEAYPVLDRAATPRPEVDAGRGEWIARPLPGPGTDARYTSGTVTDAARLIVRREELVKARAAFPMLLPGAGLVPPRWVVRDFIEESTLSVLFGDPSAGKSFIAVDLACCIATGTAWRGFPIRKPGPVSIIAGEGATGLHRRIVAWAYAHGMRPDAVPVAVSTHAAALCDPDRMSGIGDALEGHALDIGMPSLVIVDTWSRNMGGDENSTLDSSQAVAALDALRDRFLGCATLVVHHSGNGAKDRGRGSSVLRAAADSEISATKDADGVITLSSAKPMKDGRPFPGRAFRLREIGLGVLDEGREVTSCVLDDCEISEERELEERGASPRLGRNETLMLKSLRDLESEYRKNLLADGRSDVTPTVRLETWRARCLVDIESSRFSEAKNRLASKGLIVLFGSSVRSA